MNRALPQADGDPRETDTDMDGPLEQRQDVGRGDQEHPMEGIHGPARDRGLDTQGAGALDDGSMLSREQDDAIRLLQRQVKALQDYIDATLPRTPGAAVGVNWPTGAP